MQPSEYLKQRVGKVVIGSEKIFNEGAKLIAHVPGWESYIDSIIQDAWDTLLRYTTRSKSSTYSAAVKLTFASDLIGKRICRVLDLDSSNIKSTLSLGDLLLETFLQDDLIEIYREYEGVKAPYVVRIKNQSDDIKPVLIGTSFEPLEPISGLISPLTKDPYIKGWSNNQLFKQYLDTPFVKALNKLRATEWRLNTDILDALYNNPPPDYVELVDDNGEIFTYWINKENKLPDNLKYQDGTAFLGKKDARLQKVMSKHFEYTQIVTKAQMVRNMGGRFFQEVSCDYRGRVYYAESFLDFQGSDMARSLYLFAEKKVVTEKGFRWLLIHAANSYNKSFHTSELASNAFTTDYARHLTSEGLDTISLDKMTLKDREQWSRNNLEFIFSVAKNKQVCKEAEKPYAFLAVCIEITNYINCWLKSERYYTGLPIPVDGSNNGWQHLAAMSRDKQAGSLVSLTNEPIQKDFYVAVAKDLIKLMPDWFEEKKIPMKHIRKGIAKRGSMTRAYSAGKQRIAKNMYDDCHVEGFTIKYGIDESTCDSLAGNLIKAINQVCAGPLRTTKYLQKIAEHELSNGRNTLEWITPSGFPVIYKAYLQHERKQRGTIKGIKGNKDGRITHVVRIDVLTKEGSEKVPCRRSFASGIAPNFVHSLDAAHMVNTINAFDGSFAAVHDSFSTHPDDVDFLQEAIKETFIAQYDVPNFFEVIRDMLMLHKDTFEVSEPALGKLDINEVRNSEYFFC